MKKSDFISFIVPVHNSADTLEKCLESIEDVGYPQESVEIIIVDNGSKDKTLDIASKFTDKIFVDQTATIAGLRNIGSKKANGDFIIFIDSDCVLSQNWVKSALEYFNDDTVGMVGARTSLVPADATWVERTWKLHLDRQRHKREVSWIISRAIIMRRDVFLEMGGFDETLITCEDVEFGYRMREKYKIIADENLAPMHLKGEKTLGEFFKKERWRGKHSMKVGMKHLKQEKKEILSMILLFYYLFMPIFLLTAVFLTIITKNTVYIWSILVAIVAPIAFLSFDTCRRTSNYRNIGRLFILYGTYILVRIWAIFR